MSIAVSRRVWESSEHSGAAFTVLLALADYATDDGVAYPGIDALARKCRLSERTTQYAIGQLRASGEVDVEAGGGRHRTHRYVVRVAETVQDLHPNTPTDEPKTVQILRSESSDTVQDLHRMISETVQITTETVQSIARNGAESAPNPSVTTRSTVSTPRKKQHDESIREIYEYYRSKIQPTARLCPDDKIRARLRRFTADELKAGIDNFAANSWSMDHNAHRGPSWFFKSDERSEGYLHLRPESDQRVEAGCIEPPHVNGTASKVAPATDADRATWGLALETLRDFVNRANFESYIAPLEVGGRLETGGLCLIVPAGIPGESVARFRDGIRRALMEAGDPAPTAVAFKARRSQREISHAE